MSPQIQMMPRNEAYPVCSDSESSDDGDDGDSYCYCGGSDKGHTMFACDGCQKWFHHRCVGIPKRAFKLVNKFFCVDCRSEKKRTCYFFKCKYKPCWEAARIHLGKEDDRSLYCSDRHQDAWAETEVISRVIDDRNNSTPTLGGALTLSDLAMLVKQNPTMAQFKALGKKPTLSTYLELFGGEDATEKTENFLLSLAEDKSAEFLYVTLEDLKKFANGTATVEEIKSQLQANKDEEKPAVFAFDYQSLFDEKELVKIKAAATKAATYPEIAAIFRKKLLVFKMVGERADRICTEMRALGFKKKDICGSHHYTAGNADEMRLFFNSDVWTKAVEGGGFEHPPVDKTTLEKDSHDGTCLLGNKNSCPVHKFPQGNWREVKRDVAISWAKRAEDDRKKQIGIIRNELEIAESRAAMELSQLQFEASNK